MRVLQNCSLPPTRTPDATARVLRNDIGPRFSDFQGKLTLNPPGTRLAHRDQWDQIDEDPDHRAVRHRASDHPGRHALSSGSPSWPPRCPMPAASGIITGPDAEDAGGARQRDPPLPRDDRQAVRRQPHLPAGGAAARLPGHTSRAIVDDGVRIVETAGNNPAEVAAGCMRPASRSSTSARRCATR